jgi:hypothetical protein
MPLDSASAEQTPNNAETTNTGTTVDWYHQSVVIVHNLSLSLSLVCLGLCVCVCGHTIGSSTITSTSTGKYKQAHARQQCR